jgi:flagellar biosynthesis GTPase FlhF
MKMTKSANVNFALTKYQAVLAIIFFTGIIAVTHAQVNQDELQQNLPQIVFINYEGPHARIDTREQIRQLGAVLGQQVAENERGLAPALAQMTVEQRRAHSYRFQAGALNRYFVIHCISGPENGKIDADIFGIGVDAGVDHIRNLRRIIQGYLQEAYDYSESDAFLLAEYITIYNAVYRGNWDYFSSRFKTMVMDNLIRDRAGLSIRYDEWPGRTMMLIPLGHGGLSAIDTSIITDTRVIEELRREDDRGVPQRQQMVELMERQAEQTERQAQVERQEIRQEERQIVQERQEIVQERQEIVQERQRVQEELEAGRITGTQARQMQEELDRREETVQQREQELERREENVEQRREIAQRLEEIAEQITEGAQQQREEIARDQQAAIAEEAEGGVFGVMIARTEPTTMGRIVRLSLAGRELRRSPLDSVHVRTITLLGGRIFAIAGENTGRGAVRLVEINQGNLEMARQGDVDIMTGSLLWVGGNDLYAITVDLGNNQCFIGRFNTNLELQARSSVRVSPNASVIIQQGRLLTQREDGSALMLNPADLTEIR